MIKNNKQVADWEIKLNIKKENILMFLFQIRSSANPLKLIRNFQRHPRQQPHSARIRRSKEPQQHLRRQEST